MTAPSANPVPETTEEFSERLTAAIDNAALVLLMSIGHQTGLLDTLAASAGSTSEQLADAAGLEERYVRE
ncbi:methyltransferase, partial [Mycobacteroides abscessus]|nr:methyltransferase [Mycobacteroides abscessus]